MFFGAADQILDQEDNNYETEVDTELLGGVVMAYCVITPMILLAYSYEGTNVVQRTSMDVIFSFVGAFVLVAVGGEKGKYVYYILFNLYEMKKKSYTVFIHVTKK